MSPDAGTPMVRGTVRWFNAAKRFGFIAPADGGADVFVHRSDIEDFASKGMPDAHPVEYELRTGERGPQAFHVRAI